MVKSMHPYDDIIRLSHHVSAKHPPMSRENRAAQFGSFAALSGYDDAVRETARLTEEPITQEEEQIDRLNRILRALAARLEEEPVAVFTYFEPDKKKNGGAYRSLEGVVRRIDGFEGVVEVRTAHTPETRVKIPIDRIISIEGDHIGDPDFEDIPPDED